MTESLTDNCLRYLIYSQGLPLAITIFVLIVDEVGHSYTSDDTYLPNMGKYSCFIDNGYLGIGNSYFSHPIFIYFQSFMLVLHKNKHCERSCELLRYTFWERFEKNFQVDSNLFLGSCQSSKLFIILCLLWNCLCIP